MSPIGRPYIGQNLKQSFSHLMTTTSCAQVTLDTSPGVGVRNNFDHKESLYENMGNSERRNDMEVLRSMDL